MIARVYAVSFGRLGGWCKRLSEMGFPDAYSERTNANKGKH
jgi:hypothetical protein